MTRIAEHTTSRGTDHDHQLGFTLVEVLISMVLASFILGLLGNTLHSFSSGWDRQSALVEHQDMIRRGINILRRDLRSLRRVNAAGTERSGLVFEANASTLSFVTKVPAYPSQEGVVAVRYSVEQRSEGQQLIRRVAHYKAGARLSALTFRDPVEITSGLSQVAFAFRAPPSSGSQTWQRTWANPDALPNLVRLQFSDAGKSTYPSAIIAIRSTAKPQCVVALSPPCTVSPKGQRQ